MAIAPAVLYRTNRIEVSFTKDGTYKTLSLSAMGLLQSSDTHAVCLEIENTSATTSYVAGARGYGASEDFAAQVRYTSHVFCLVECSDAYHLVQFKAANAAVRFWIHAEFVSPGAVVHATPSDRLAANQTQLATWYNRVVLLEGDDTPDDVEAVLLLCHTDSANNSYWSARAYGSTATKLYQSGQLNRLFWLPCKVSSLSGYAWYQLYCTGKYLDADPPVFQVWSKWYELGYIRKGYGFRGIETTVDEAPGQATSWQSRTASSVIPAGAEGIVPVHTSGVATVHGIREIGSTNPTKAILDPPSNSYGAIPLRLDSSNQYQFRDDATTPELRIFGYTLPLVELTGDVEVVVEASGDVEAHAMLSGDVEIAVDVEGELTPHAMLSGDVEIAIEATGDLRRRRVVPTGDPQVGGRVRARLEVDLRAPAGAVELARARARPEPIDQVATAEAEAPRVRGRPVAAGLAAGELVAIDQVRARLELAEVRADLEVRARARARTIDLARISAEPFVAAAVRGGVQWAQ